MLYRELKYKNSAISIIYTWYVPIIHKHTAETGVIYFLNFYRCHNVSEWCETVIRVLKRDGASCTQLYNEYYIIILY